MRHVGCMCVGLLLYISAHAMATEPTLYVYQDGGHEVVSQTPREGLRLLEVITPKKTTTPRNLPVRGAKTHLELIVRHARAHGLEPALVLGVVETESHFNAGAVSHAGAVGLMQLMPVHWPKLADKNPYDPDENVRVGCAYLAKLLRVHKGDLHRALAAYNAGSGTVRRVGGPPRFTLTYISRIMRARVRWRRYLGVGSKTLIPSTMGPWLGRNP